MNNNSSQDGSTPLEALSNNNRNEPNMNEILSIGFMITSQSFIPMNTRNMIPTPNPRFYNR